MRNDIVNAFVVELNKINGRKPYNTTINKNAHKGIKFWDNINDYPAIYVAAGSETREYQPAEFKWGFLNMTVRLFVKESDPQDRLDKLIEDVEYVIDNNLCLTYDTNKTTVDMRILAIQTDEGILEPYGAGEIIVQVRYDL